MLLASISDIQCLSRMKLGVKAGETNMDQIAHQRSNIYGLFATLLNSSPDHNLVGFIKKFSSLQDEAEIFLPTNSDNEDILKGMALWQSFAEQNKFSLSEEIYEKLAVDWTRLFRGIKPGYGPPPPYESVYATGFERQENARIYTEAGLRLTANVREEADYLGIQLDFMRHVAEQEGHIAFECDYLRNHLNSWVARYVEKAYPESSTDFYRGLLLVLKGYLTANENYLTYLKDEVLEEQDTSSQVSN